MLDGSRLPPAAGGPARNLVVFLHGYGADGGDLIGLADPLAPHLPDTRFLAPNAPERCLNNPMGYQWFPIPWLDGSPEAQARASAARSFRLLDSWLDDLARTMPPARTVLFGFSQGTMMALHVGLRRKAAFAGIVGFSGRLLDVLYPVAAKLSGGAAADEIAAAAEGAAQATIPMKAVRGRASFLGERSVGHMDPGAFSSALLIKKVAELIGK